MITKTITANISSSSVTAPWTYSFYDNNSTGCVEITNPGNITSSNTITTDLIFSTSGCIAAVDIKLSVTGSNGCNVVYDVELTDSCESFDVGDIHHTAPFIFSVTPSGGTPPYTYDWYWNENILKIKTLTSNQPTITLGVINGVVLPPSTTVHVTVIDSEGCEQEASLTHVFCKPTAANTTALLACNYDGGACNYAIFLPVTPCGGIDLDYTSLQFTNQPSGLNITHPWLSDPLEDENRIELCGTDTLATGDYFVYYTIADEYGIRSDEGRIWIRKPNCPEVDPITVPNQVYQMECGVIATDTYDIDITDLVVPNTNVDWDTFEFVSSGDVTAVTVLGAANGYSYPGSPNVSYNAVTHVITYEIPTTSGTDSFQWTIQTDEDVPQTSNAGIYTIVIDCAEAPTAVADATCANCGEVTTIDILANDTITGSTINPQSVTITESPTNGTVVVNTDGTVDYTPNAGYAGSDTFKYTVFNTAVPPSESNEVTVTITVICAGEDISISVCN